MTPSFSSRLAVCSWSLQPSDPAELVQKLQAIGITRVQIALDPVREKPGIWGKTVELLRRHNITMVSGMFGTAGEDYSSLDSIRRTGGVVADATWDENWANISTNAVLARKLGLKLVTFHAGFLPHAEVDPDYKKLRERIVLIADRFAAKGIDIGLETGQETAETLRAFLTAVNRPNIGVNFDPANMVLYDKGDPIGALRMLGPWLKQCHIKDATRTKTPGTWGQEVVVGTGDVNWRAFFRELNQLKFEGSFCIEREAGSQRVADIQAVRRFVESL